MDNFFNLFFSDPFRLVVLGSCLLCVLIGIFFLGNLIIDFIS